MTSKCPNCGKYFDTVKGMRIHKADCQKKDPLGIRGIQKQHEKNKKNIRKMFDF